MSEASTPYERHPTLHFPDGDIALSAKTRTGITQVFRVDRIVLSRHSEVFRDMLAVASDKSNPEERFEDIPLVTMPEDDAAEDLQSLLEVIYDASYVFVIILSRIQSLTFFVRVPAHCTAS